MPRTSYAALNTPAVLVPGHGRPKPPPDMPVPETVVWNKIVQAMPGNWFGPECHDILWSLCSHTVTLHAVMKRKAELLATRWKPKDLEVLTDLHAHESRCVASLASKLRLTPSARINQNHATSQYTRAAKHRPWEKGAVAA